MANIEVTIDATGALRELNATVNQVTLVRIAELLGAETDVAVDWLIIKVAQFRGISESDAHDLIHSSDRAV